MDIFNTQLKEISQEIKDLLKEQRIKRNFNIEEYVQEKKNILNQYMNEYNLKSCVVGISGGIDSAIVLYLINEAKKEINSNIENIICVYMPVNNNGMSNKESSYLRAKELCDNIGVDLITLDLTNVNKAYEELIPNSINLDSNEWSKGQLVSYSRTPALYYVSTLLNQHNKKAIIVGTTNKDEGAYIGYIGKASDAMVDIQLISDIYKSEVYKIAKYLNVPESIINVAPSGDMYDSRKDEEVFGTSYDFVELYTYYLNNKDIINKLSNDKKEEFFIHSENIENLHKYNKHKYLACSQAIHLDILPSKVENGWNYNTYKRVESYFINQKLVYNDFINIFDKDYKIEHKIKKFYLTPKQTFQTKKVEMIQNVLKTNEIKSILNYLNNKNWIDVGYDGILKNFNENDNVGSKRVSIYSEEFANILWERVKSFYYDIKTDEYSLVDNDNHKEWRPIGINPLFRFIKYDKDNLLVNHYDSPYIIDGNKRTMKTLVIYLTTNTQGSTRFYKDEQDSLTIGKRDFKDWITSGNIDELDKEFYPKSGNVLTFNHRILHDSEPITINETKIIIRTDVIFEKI